MKESDIIRAMMLGGAQASPMHYDGPMMIDGLTYDEFMDQARQKREGTKEGTKPMAGSPLEIMLSNNRDQRTMELMAQGLRNRKDVATLAMLSGDETVGRFGGSLSGDVETRVQQRLTEREKQKQRDLTQGYYDQLGEQFAATDAHRKNVLAETIRHHKELEEAARLKAAGGGYKKPTDTAIKESRLVIEASQNMKQIRDSFKDEFAKGDKGEGDWLPYEGDIVNFAGRRGWGSDEAKAQGTWWAAYQNLYELPQRNAMFGSALTESEKQAWKDANIDPNMSADVIKERLEVLQGIANNAMGTLAGIQAEVYGPEYAYKVYGPYMTDQSAGRDTPQPGADSSAPQRNVSQHGFSYEIIEDDE